MERELKIAIIGCGGIANGKHMPSLTKIKNVKIVAFCDIILEKAKEAKEKYGTEDARVYISYKELLDNEKDVEVVHVCTPNGSHCEITCYALEKNKHVMCEKPMAKTSKEAELMMETAEKVGKKLTIGYQNRCTPDNLYLNKVCKNNELGEIYYAKAHALRRRAVPTWGVFLDEEAQGGGPLIDIGTHALDMTLWHMNNYEPKSVKGTVYRKLADQTETGNIFGEWDPKEYTVEDSAFGFITMKNGATILLESSWALNILDAFEARTTLCGTNGGVDMNDGVRINKIIHGKQAVIKPDTSTGGVDFFEGTDLTNPADMEAHLWVEAILNDTEPLVKPYEAYIVTKILEAIYQSAKTGKEIYFD